MPAGRPPKPTKLKLLTGNPGRRPLGNEPMPPPRTRVPAPPGNMGQHGKREWRRVAKILVAQGLLTDLDMTAFRAYCHLYHRWYVAEEALLDSGLMLRSTSTGGIYQNPYLSIAKSTLRELDKWGAKFGLSPSDRSRIGANDADPDGEIEEFLYGNQPRIS